ncbi:FKBP-type peptidyl-prolyl cis-trans isomerase [Chitinophaga horti]|uniref:Peptidyl-prolyl cis-trans isomerase n=1 Tax=Chitinophaga horti TaxID=2920382 RepID=A0ABY6J998_9BACT|nr:FKBP-type peptidyl-prolyl cis-trans isomerase [Chitinophaga horti]UYQ95152.1 FKBP-type peptidyl-prolyl cis-trans isomerase [Chitinophaga horti]
MKKNNLLLVASCGLLLLASCAPKQRKTPGGIDYTIDKSGSGEQLKIGDTAMMFIYTRLNDSIMFESRKQQGGAIPVPIQKSVEKYDLMDGFSELHVGDSATFVLLVDSLPQMPPFAKKGDKIRLTFVVDSKYTIAGQTAKEEKEISEYLKKKSLTTTTKTASGVNVAVTAEGAGAQPQPGDTVVVNYTGSLLDGKVFDSNVDSTIRPGMPLEPLRFPIGRGFVIKGWDEGIAALKKGTKATLVIPSAVAYGFQGNPPTIPGNSILAFTVELLDVIPGSAAAPEVAPTAPAAPAN